MENKDPAGAAAGNREPSGQGEAAFAAVLLLLGAAAFAAALKLWLRMPPPRAASAGAVPLFASGVWVLAALLNTVGIARRRARGGDARTRFSSLRFALPDGVLLMLGMIAAYCALLYAGAGFYAATPLFLYAAMCALTKGNYIKNLIWTAAVMAAVTLIFRLLLGVVFP